MQTVGAHWLTADTVEIRFERPRGFVFRPGQKIRFDAGAVTRDYTLVNAPDDALLAICVRRAPSGRFSPGLTGARPGDVFNISGPMGYFTYQTLQRQAVFVGAGTGVAPFLAFARAGIKGFHLLRGVRSMTDLFYHGVLTGAARSATICLSGKSETTARGVFPGRVTDYLERRLPSGAYDFYLCGSGEMIADATLIIDRRFSGSSIFSESFF